MWPVSLMPPPTPVWLHSGCRLSQVNKYKYALKICINYNQPQVRVIDSLRGSVESSRDRWRFGLHTNASSLLRILFSRFSWKSVQKHLLHTQIFGSCLHVFGHNIKVVEGILQLIFMAGGWTTSPTKATPPSPATRCSPDKLLCDGTCEEKMTET